MLSKPHPFIVVPEYLNEFLNWKYSLLNLAERQKIVRFDPDEIMGLMVSNDDANEPIITIKKTFKNGKEITQEQIDKETFFLVPQEKTKVLAEIQTKEVIVGLFSHKEKKNYKWVKDYNSLRNIFAKLTKEEPKNIQTFDSELVYNILHTSKQIWMNTPI